jgi:hypothetical protein
MEGKISKELVWHRLEQAKEDLETSKLLYREKYTRLQTIEHIMQYFMQ